MVQSKFATAVSWAERASAMVGTCVRKISMSPARIARSEGEIWALRWAVASSMTEWRSVGREGLLEGRVERVWVRRWSVWWVVRSWIRFCVQSVRMHVSMFNDGRDEMTLSRK